MENTVGIQKPDIQIPDILGSGFQKVQFLDLFWLDCQKVKFKMTAILFLKAEQQTIRQPDWFYFSENSLIWCLDPN